jgi:transposase
MYVRTTQRRNADGSVVRYVQLAAKERVAGKSVARVLVNLGREDALDREGLARLVASINRYLGVRDAPAPQVTGMVGEELTVSGSRPMGATYLLDGLWRQLGIDTALGRVLDARRFSTDVERVLFALVANRAVDPLSKLAAAEWASEDVLIDGLAEMDDDQAYRAMDLLADDATIAKVQESVFFAVATLLNLEVDFLLFDTTSTYWECDSEDPETDDGTTGLRRYGHSKDHREDLPQIVIGLAVTKEGIPVRCWCWPGNTTDVTVLPQVKDDLTGWKLGRVITVVDRGLSSAANLSHLTRAGGQYIAGARMRDGNKLAQAALARAGRYQDVRDNLRVKEVRLDEQPGVRWIICHNPEQAAKDKADRGRQLDAVRAELERITALRAKATPAKGAGKGKGKSKDAAVSEPAAHVKAECALRDHKALGRWVKQTPSGRLILDTAKVADEERLDGKYLLSTSDPSLPAGEVALGYKNLLEAERAFRDMKSTLALRPVYHRLEPRIRAHVLLCWLALLLVRVAERRTGQTWATINRQLGRVHAVTLTGTVGTVVHTTPLTTAQAGIVSACGLPQPPAVTALDPS